VRPGPALENLTGAIVEIARSGLSPDQLRDRVLPRLRRAVPFDASFWATVDPATLLFTQPHQEEIPRGTIPYFVHNEFLDDDVNKWTALARDRRGVGTLAAAPGAIWRRARGIATSSSRWGWATSCQQSSGSETAAGDTSVCTASPA
jgi:hypothetical protein